MAAVPAVDGHLSVASGVEQAFACGGHGGRVGVEPLDEIPVAGCELFRQGAIAAAEVDDDAAFDAGGFEDFVLCSLCGVPRCKQGGQLQVDRFPGVALHGCVLLLREVCTNGGRIAIGQLVDWLIG